MKGSQKSLGQNPFLYFPKGGGQFIRIGNDILQRPVEHIQVHGGFHPLAPHDHGVDGTHFPVLLGNGFVEVGGLITDDQVYFNAVLVLKILGRLFEIIGKIPGVKSHFPFRLGGFHDAVPVGGLQIHRGSLGGLFRRPSGKGQTRRRTQNQQQHDNSFHKNPPFFIFIYQHHIFPREAAK